MLQIMLGFLILFASVAVYVGMASASLWWIAGAFLIAMAWAFYCLGKDHDRYVAYRKQYIATLDEAGTEAIAYKANDPDTDETTRRFLCEYLVRRRGVGASGQDPHEAVAS